MLAGLLKRTVGSGDDKDSAVHLSRTGDHVLDIVGVSGAVDMSVVTFCGLVLNVTGIDCDSACSLFGSVIDLVVCHELDVSVSERKILRDRGGKGGLAVVDVTDGTDIDVGFCSFEFSLCHSFYPP